MGQILHVFLWGEAGDPSLHVPKQATPPQFTLLDAEVLGSDTLWSVSAYCWDGRNKEKDGIF